MRTPPRGELPLSAYGLIGDGRTAALVATDGSIDWMCHGRFDGPAVLCRLLDPERGGYFQVAPATAAEASQRYLGRTNVLVTELRCATGAIRLTDCMALDWADGPVVLRKLEGLAGTVPVRIELVPTFDFARADTIVATVPGGCVARAANAQLRLACATPMTVADGRASGALELRAGQTRWIVLTHGSPPLDDEASEQALRSTLAAWERWSAHGTYPTRYEHLLRRSALVLKLLIHAPTGAMIAAPTTSLPECPGAERNWDYRFTWLRDASWVVSALMDLGYHDESMAFIGWLESLRLAERPPSVFYDLDGDVPRDEHEVWGLRGYRGSRPVRVGNAAAGQDQHDIFGEVVAAIAICSERMASMRPLRPGLWRMVTALAEHAATHWAHADHGMWEVRDRPRHFLSSKLLCWSALDRAIAIARRDRLAGPVARWGEVRDRIARAILVEGFDPALGSFRRALDEPALDASALLLPRYGLVPADDPRVVRTVATVRDRLAVGGGLLRRYVVLDGLPGEEGAFTACTFWLVDCLARQHRVDEACALFEQVTAHASGTGLMSEQLEPASGALIGNYPQALTHLALVRAAVAIARAEGQASGRARPHHRAREVT